MAMGEDILVVKKEILFKEGEFKGFLPIEKKDFISIILKNFEYKTRTDELEYDLNWQQPTTYVWIINPKEKKVFIYKRSKKGNEGRLFDMYSGGVGGHIDKNTEKHSKNPIVDAMMRELKEETIMKNYPSPKIVGFIKLDGGIEDFHIGIVGITETEDEVEPAEDMASGKFYTINEAIALFEDKNIKVERWTQASWPFIKEYLQST